MDECTELSAGGLQTSIVVDESKVAHYGVEVDLGRGKAVSWIASEVDKEFAIHVSVDGLPKSNAYGVLVFIDGLLVTSAFFNSNSEKRARTITGVRISQTEKRKFVFGALEFLEDELSLDAASSKKPGQIGIMLQTSNSPEKRRPSDARHPFVVPAHDKVHEGNSKGMAHQVKYSEPREDRLASPKKQFHFENPITLAKHVIKYRPLAILQANGVLPPPSHPPAQITADQPPQQAADITTDPSSSSYSPQPPPSSSNSPQPCHPPPSRKRKPKLEPVKPEPKEEECEGEEDREERIRKRRRELMAELAKLEEEEDRARASRRPGRPVKHEVKQEPRGARSAPSEVIDLTL